LQEWRARKELEFYRKTEFISEFSKMQKRIIKEMGIVSLSYNLEYKNLNTTNKLKK